MPPRLTIRGLQERRRKAQEACVEVERLVDRWQDEKVTMNFITPERQLEEDDRVMARAVETIREDACNSGRAVPVRTAYFKGLTP